MPSVPRRRDTGNCVNQETYDIKEDSNAGNGSTLNQLYWPTSLGFSFAGLVGSRIAYKVTFD